MVQSSSPSQRVWQTPARQTKLPHDSGAAGRQAPVVSQREITAERLSALQVAVPQVAPGVAGEQVPVGLAQLWHVPHEACTQQVPFTQLPVRHSAPAMQLAPAALRMRAPQVPPVQTLPPLQSPSARQLVRQAPPRHW